jgi:hypothetical protein
VISGLELHNDSGEMVLQLRTRSDAELEAWATNMHLQPFEQLVDKTVRIEVVPREAHKNRPPPKESAVRSQETGLAQESARRRRGTTRRPPA